MSRPVAVRRSLKRQWMSVLESKGRPWPVAARRSLKRQWMSVLERKRRYLTASGALAVEACLVENGNRLPSAIALTFDHPLPSPVVGSVFVPETTLVQRRMLRQPRDERDRFHSWTR